MAVQLFEKIPFIGIDFWRTEKKPGITFHLYSDGLFNYEVHFDKRLRNATLRIDDDKIEIAGETFYFVNINNGNKIYVKDAERDGLIYTTDDIRLSFPLRRKMLKNKLYFFKKKEAFSLVVSAKDNIYKVIMHSSSKT